MRLFLFFLSVFSLSLFVACDIINPEEEIPAYIASDSAVLVTNYDLQGSNAHNISDAWIYVDGKLVGVFEMPFSIPVLAAGTKSVVIQAGIKNNGVAASRVVYPFYTKYTIDTTLTPGEVLRLTPQFEYQDVNFVVKEDFEDLGIVFAVSAQSDTSINLVSGNEAFEGNSMFFALDSVRDVFECRSTDLYELPYGKNVFLEMTFKNNDYFTFGVFARKYNGGTDVEIRVPIITFNPTDTYKTIYISLANAITSNSQAYDFRLYYTCTHSDESLNDTTRVFIDNVKLIY